MRVILAVVAVVAAGCGGDTLAGDWEGEISCSGGAAGLEIELDADDARTTSGSGITWFDDAYGYYWEIAFDLALEHGRIKDGAEIAVEVEGCVEFELGDVDCPELEDVIYLADDTLEGEVDSFFGASGCEFEVER